MTFNFTNPLIAFKSRVRSAPANALWNELLGYINTIGGAASTFFPASKASSLNKVLISSSNSTGATAWNSAMLADANVSMTGVASLAAGDMLYFNGTNFVEVSVGTTGQALVLSGTTPTWSSVAFPLTWVAKTSTFTITDNGRYQCNAGITANLFTASNIDDEFWIKPAIGQDFGASPLTVARVGSEQIGGVAANFSCDFNAIFHFVANAAGNWDVSIEQIGRSS